MNMMRWVVCRFVNRIKKCMMVSGQRLTRKVMFCGGFSQCLYPRLTLRAVCGPQDDRRDLWHFAPPHRDETSD